MAWSGGGGVEVLSIMVGGQGWQPTNCINITGQRP